MKMTYPSKSANILGSQEQIESTAILWAKHLHNIEDEFIKLALDECVNKFAWMPDIAEFKKLAMSFKGNSRIPWVEDVMKFEKPKYEVKTNPSVERFIEEGSKVCKLIKLAYPQLTWWKIADKFTELKRKLRDSGVGKDNIEICLALQKFSLEDIQEALG